MQYCLFCADPIFIELAFVVLLLAMCSFPCTNPSIQVQVTGSSIFPSTIMGVHRFQEQDPTGRWRAMLVLLQIIYFSLSYFRLANMRPLPHSISTSAFVQCSFFGHSASLSRISSNIMSTTSPLPPDSLF